MDAQASNRRHRRRSTSPARFGKATKERDYLRARIDEFAREQERHSRMTSREKITESGLQLQHRIESDHTLTFLLQPTPPAYMARAKCRAGFCIPAQKIGESMIEIKDSYRVVLVGRRTEREYFHVACLSKMLDLPSLAPTRFKLDMDSYRWNDSWPWTWGLMLRKWFENSGCIDLNKIADYIKARRKYDKIAGDLDTANFDWQFGHECPKERTPCECTPPEALKAPPEPTLSDYRTSEDHPCSLSKVLRHRYAEKFALEIHIGGIFNVVSY